MLRVPRGFLPTSPAASIVFLLWAVPQQSAAAAEAGEDVHRSEDGAGGGLLSLSDTSSLHFRTLLWYLLLTVLLAVLGDWAIWEARRRLKWNRGPWESRLRVRTPEVFGSLAVGTLFALEVVTWAASSSSSAASSQLLALRFGFWWLCLTLLLVQGFRKIFWELGQRAWAPLPPWLEKRTPLSGVLRRGPLAFLLWGEGKLPTQTDLLCAKALFLSQHDLPRNFDFLGYLHQRLPELGSGYAWIPGALSAGIFLFTAVVLHRTDAFFRSRVSIPGQLALMASGLGLSLLLQGFLLLRLRIHTHRILSLGTDTLEYRLAVARAKAKGYDGGSSEELSRSSQRRKLALRIAASRPHLPRISLLDLHSTTVLQNRVSASAAVADAGPRGDSRPSSASSHRSNSRSAVLPQQQQQQEEQGEGGRSASSSSSSSSSSSAQQPQTQVLTRVGPDDLIINEHDYLRYLPAPPIRFFQASFSTLTWTLAALLALCVLHGIPEAFRAGSGVGTPAAVFLAFWVSVVCFLSVCGPLSRMSERLTLLAAIYEPFQDRYGVRILKDMHEAQELLRDFHARVRKHRKVFPLTRLLSLFDVKVSASRDAKTSAAAIAGIRESPLLRDPKPQSGDTPGESGGSSSSCAGAAVSEDRMMTVVRTGGAQGVSIPESLEEDLAGDGVRIHVQSEDPDKGAAEEEDDEAKAVDSGERKQQQTPSTSGGEDGGWGWVNPSSESRQYLDYVEFWHFLEKSLRMQLTHRQFRLLLWALSQQSGRGIFCLTSSRDPGPVGAGILALRRALAAIQSTGVDGRNPEMDDGLSAPLASLASMITLRDAKILLHDRCVHPVRHLPFLLKDEDNYDRRRDLVVQDDPFLPQGHPETPQTRDMRRLRERMERVSSSRSNPRQPTPPVHGGQPHPPLFQDMQQLAAIAEEPEGYHHHYPEGGHVFYDLDIPTHNNGDGIGDILHHRAAREIQDTGLLLELCYGSDLTVQCLQCGGLIPAYELAMHCELHRSELFLEESELSDEEEDEGHDRDSMGGHSPGFPEMIQATHHVSHWGPAYGDHHSSMRPLSHSDQQRGFHHHHPYHDPHQLGGDRDDTHHSFSGGSRQEWHRSISRRPDTRRSFFKRRPFTRSSPPPPPPPSLAEHHHHHHHHHHRSSSSSSRDDCVREQSCDLHHKPEAEAEGSRSTPLPPPTPCNTPFLSEEDSAPLPRDPAPILSQPPHLNPSAAASSVHGPMTPPDQPILYAWSADSSSVQQKSRPPHPAGISPSNKVDFGDSASAAAVMENKNSSPSSASVP